MDGRHYYGTRYLTLPSVTRDAESAAYVASVVDAARRASEPPLLALDDRYSRHEFLRLAVEHLGVLLHGSHDRSITAFQPRAGEDYFGNQITAAYAADDGTWPLFFALINRDNPLLTVLWNACEWATDDAGVREHVYFFSVNQGALGSDTLWREGTVYLLPRDDFRQITDEDGQPLAEHTCEHIVRPIAKLAVRPDDFPFRDAVIGVDPTDLDRHQQILAAVTDVVDEAAGCTLHLDRGLVATTLVRQVAEFLVRLNPGWTVRIAETDTHIRLTFDFAAGAVNFCTRQVRADLA